MPRTPFRAFRWTLMLMTCCTIAAALMPQPSWAAATTYTIINANDDGPGSLRDALELANINIGTDTIEFDIPGAGVHTIDLETPLPPLSQPIIIDGSTQPGASCTGDPGATLLIELNGTGAGVDANGFTITGGGATIRGLVINRFDGNGIEVNDNGNNTIVCNFIGTDPTGTVAQPNYSGILFYDGPTGDRVGGVAAADRNLLSGNEFSGISFAFTYGQSFVRGNYIGVDISGTKAIPNDTGIRIATSSFVVVGGTDPGAGNLVSGNTAQGIDISSAHTNTIQGNLIGTDLSGALDLGNGFTGIRSLAGNFNLIGGTTPSAKNLISGNGYYGIELSAEPVEFSTSNVVQGNYIGTNLLGTQSIRNEAGGVRVSYGAESMQIGGSEPGAGNLISGNFGPGIEVLDRVDYAFGTISTTIQGNYIGTNAAGTESIPNTSNGILLTNAQLTLIGGATPGARNLISGNRLDGIQIAGSVRTQVFGNYVGTNFDGTAAIPNSRHGVSLVDTIGTVEDEVIANGSTGNAIGGSASGEGNLISANLIHGVFVTFFASADNTIHGNRIGTAVDGVSPLGNGQDGVRAENSGPNYIGGLDAGEGNIIAYNGVNGVANALLVTVSTKKLIAGNSIHDNEGLGIDLIYYDQQSDTIITGVSPNDEDDSDGGPNELQNFPVLSDATNTNGNDLQVTVNFVSAANTTFRIEFYASDACDASGFGEGERVLGRLDDVQTDDDGAIEFDATLPDQAQPAGTILTAVAIDPENNTSELSACAEINQSPLAVDDQAQTPQATAVLIDVLANDLDPNGDGLTIDSLTVPTNGTVIIQAGQVLYTPNAGFTGIDEFDYQVSDGQGGIDTATVLVTVVAAGDGDNTPDNDAPVAVDDQAETLVDTPVGIGVLTNDFDPDGDVLSVTAFTAPANGSAQNLGGVLIYTPDAGFSGQDSFGYTISDPGGLSDSAVVTVIVSAQPGDQPGVNDPPVAVDDADVTPVNTPLVIEVLANDFDPEGDTLTIVQVSEPNHGTAVIQGTQILYTPNNGYTGADNFTYAITDGNGGFDSAVVSLGIGLPNPTNLDELPQPSAPGDGLWLPKVTR